jgi:uncharacterized protein (TIGR02271 family)
MSTRESGMIIGKDGARGHIVQLDQAQADQNQVLIQFEQGARVLVPWDALVPQANGDYYYLPLSLADLQEHNTTTAALEFAPIVIPVAAESIQVQKRTVETGRVRIQKLVHEQEELVDEPLHDEEVQVERVQVNRVVDAAPAPRQDGDTMIIPVLKEVLVVEKRLLLKEEIHVTRRHVERREPQRFLLRREEVTVERLAASDAEPGSATGGT